MTYTITRTDAALETLAEGVTGLSHADPAARTGAGLRYQVTAVADGGEPVRSALVEVSTPGNSPPLPVGTLPDRWLRVDDSAGVEVGDAFVDPEGDALTYGASASATGVATASASGTRVTIDPVGAGTATITVTATDAGGSGASAMQAFEVTVRSSSAVDYDADDDGLIDITTLARLDAVRHGLDGDGVPDADGAAAYAAAFSSGGDRPACGGLTGCVGYELGADLDFDTNGQRARRRGRYLPERRRRLGAARVFPAPDRVRALLLFVRGDLRAATDTPSPICSSIVGLSPTRCCSAAPEGASFAESA